MTTPISTGQLDRIVLELERLHGEANRILDAHTDYLSCIHPTVPFGTLKFREIAKPAGSSINYVAALKLVRSRLLGEAPPA